MLQIAHGAMAPAKHLRDLNSAETGEAKFQHASLLRWQCRKQRLHLVRLFGGECFLFRSRRGVQNLSAAAGDASGLAARPSSITTLSAIAKSQPWNEPPRYFGKLAKALAKTWAVASSAASFDPSRR
jgi:hypothetical protein